MHTGFFGPCDYAARQLYLGSQ
jgi:hypothetical protein